MRRVHDSIVCYLHKTHFNFNYTGRLEENDGKKVTPCKHYFLKAQVNKFISKKVDLRAKKTI